MAELEKMESTADQERRKLQTLEQVAWELLELQYSCGMKGLQLVADEKHERKRCGIIRLEDLARIQFLDSAYRECRKKWVKWGLRELEEREIVARNTVQRDRVRTITKPALLLTVYSEDAARGKIHKRYERERTRMLFLHTMEVIDIDEDDTRLDVHEEEEASKKKLKQRQNELVVMHRSLSLIESKQQETEKVWPQEVKQRLQIQRSFLLEQECLHRHAVEAQAWSAIYMLEFKFKQVELQHTEAKHRWLLAKANVETTESIDRQAIIREEIEVWHQLLLDDCESEAIAQFYSALAQLRDVLTHPDVTNVQQVLVLWTSEETTRLAIQQQFESSLKEIFTEAAQDTLECDRKWWMRMEQFERLTMIKRREPQCRLLFYLDFTETQEVLLRTTILAAQLDRWDKVKSERREEYQQLEYKSRFVYLEENESFYRAHTVEKREFLERNAISAEVIANNEHMGRRKIHQMEVSNRGQQHLQHVIVREMTQRANIIGLQYRSETFGLMMFRTLLVLENNEAAGRNHIIHQFLITCDVHTSHVIQLQEASGRETIINEWADVNMGFLLHNKFLGLFHSEQQERDTIIDGQQCVWRQIEGSWTQSLIVLVQLEEQLERTVLQSVQQTCLLMFVDTSMNAAQLATIEEAEREDIAVQQVDKVVELKLHELQVREWRLRKEVHLRCSHELDLLRMERLESEYRCDIAKSEKEWRCIESRAVVVRCEQAVRADIISRRKADDRTTKNKLECFTTIAEEDHCRRKLFRQAVIEYVTLKETQHREVIITRYHIYTTRAKIAWDCVTVQVSESERRKRILVEEHKELAFLPDPAQTCQQLEQRLHLQQKETQCRKQVHTNENFCSQLLYREFVIHYELLERVYLCREEQLVFNQIWQRYARKLRSMRQQDMKELTTVRLLEGGHFVMTCPCCRSSLVFTKELYTMLYHYKPTAEQLDISDAAALTELPGMTMNHVSVEQVVGKRVILQALVNTTLDDLNCAPPPPPAAIAAPIPLTKVDGSMVARGLWKRAASRTDSVLTLAKACTERRQSAATSQDGEKEDELSVKDALERDLSKELTPTPKSTPVTKKFAISETVKPSLTATKTVNTHSTGLRTPPVQGELKDYLDEIHLGAKYKGKLKKKGVSTKLATIRSNKQHEASRTLSGFPDRTAMDSEAAQEKNKKGSMANKLEKLLETATASAAHFAPTQSFTEQAALQTLKETSDDRQAVMAGEGALPYDTIADKRNTAPTSNNRKGGQRMSVSFDTSLPLQGGSTNEPTTATALSSTPHNHDTPFSRDMERQLSAWSTTDQKQGGVVWADALMKGELEEAPASVMEELDTNNLHLGYDDTKDVAPLIDFLGSYPLTTFSVVPLSSTLTIGDSKVADTGELQLGVDRKLAFPVPAQRQVKQHTEGHKGTIPLDVARVIHFLNNFSKLKGITPSWKGLINVAIRQLQTVYTTQTGSTSTMPYFEHHQFDCKNRFAKLNQLLYEIHCAPVPAIAALFNNTTPTTAASNPNDVTIVDDSTPVGQIGERQLLMYFLQKRKQLQTDVLKRQNSGPTTDWSHYHSNATTTVTTKDSSVDVEKEGIQLEFSKGSSISVPTDNSPLPISLGHYVSRSSPNTPTHKLSWGGEEGRSSTVSPNSSRSGKVARHPTSDTSAFSRDTSANSLGSQPDASILELDDSVSFSSHSIGQEAARAQSGKGSKYATSRGIPSKTVKTRRRTHSYFHQHNKFAEVKHAAPAK